MITCFLILLVLVLDGRDGNVFLVAVSPLQVPGGQAPVGDLLPQPLDLGVSPHVGPQFFFFLFDSLEPEVEIQKNV